jgi:hypothetical protein
MVKKQKPQVEIKLVSQSYKLALGDDVMFPEVSDLEERAMVGRVKGHHLVIS